MVRLFRVFIPIGSLALLVSEMVLETSAFILASYVMLEVDPAVWLRYDGGLTRILLVTATVMLVMHFHDLYTELRIKSHILLLQQLSLVMGITFLVQSLVSYLNRD